MRRIFFMLIFLSLLKADYVFANQASKLFLKQAEEYYALGKKDAGAGNLDEAIKYLQKAVAINPYFAEAHYELARLYAEKGEFDRAEKEYQTAININPRLEIPAKQADLEKAEKEIIKEAEAWAKELVEKERAEKVVEREITPERKIKKEPEREKPVVEKEELKEVERVSISYLGTEQQELFPAVEKEPTIRTILDPYHPKHKGLSYPYYRDRQGGLKLNRFVGVGAKAEYEEKPVPLETLIENAEEFQQSTKEQLRRFISTNTKRFYEYQVILFFYENWWPLIKYTYHTEEVKRVYDAKYLWSQDNVWSDNQTYHELNLKYVIPGLKYLGYLNINPYYRRVKISAENDAFYFGKRNVWRLALTTAPLDDLEVFTEYTYNQTKKPRYDIAPKISKREFKVELRKNFPRARFKITPAYYFSEEWYHRSGESWDKKEISLDLEKKIGTKLTLATESGLIFLKREVPTVPQPGLPDERKVKALTFENKIGYEPIRDLFINLKYDHGTGINFKGFDYYNLGPEIRFYKPGLIDLLLGYRFTDYYKIDDELWTIYFRVGMFM